MFWCWGQNYQTNIYQRRSMYYIADMPGPWMRETELFKQYQKIFTLDWRTHYAILYDYKKCDIMPNYTICFSRHSDRFSPFCRHICRSTYAKGRKQSNTPPVESHQLIGTDIYYVSCNLCWHNKGTEHNLGRQGNSRKKIQFHSVCNLQEDGDTA